MGKTPLSKKLIGRIGERAVLLADHPATKKDMIRAVARCCKESMSAKCNVAAAALIAIVKIRIDKKEGFLFSEDILNEM